MILRRVNDVNFKHLETHDTKVFKLLSECFSRHKTFHYHLFLQIGEYNALK